LSHCIILSAGIISPAVDSCQEASLPDPFGDVFPIIAGNAPKYLLYAGEQFDIDAQQYYLRAWYYDPLNGRFNRTDPYAGSPQDPQSLHKYLYCHANPINAIDPSGQFSLTEMLTVATIVGTVIGAVAGTVTLVAGGSAREALWQATEWFWMSFAITAAVYAAVWAGSVVWAWLFGAGAASPTVKQAAEQGFGSSDALRAEWIRKIHHFVQQTPRNIANFGKQAIHSVLNSVPMPKCFHDMITNFQNSGPNTLGLDPAKYGGVSHMYQFIEGSNWETQYRWGTAMYNHVMEYGTMGGFDPTRYGL
jgi:RHS repeat-associated protein